MPADQLKPKQASKSLVETVWYIGFVGKDKPDHWWDRFLKKGYHHVYFYTELKADVLVFNMTKGGLTMFTIPLNCGKNIHIYLKELYGAGLILPANGFVNTEMVLPRVSLCTCVELARSLLGIDKWLWTPYQLCKYIINHRLAGPPL